MPVIYVGQENIDQGFRSVVIAFVAVLIFMAIYYRTFGLVANLALAFNLVLIVSVLSLLQATLTLPGIAGIVLTVGMAVDANVLIFERIREEIRNGNTPQASSASICSITAQRTPEAPRPRRTSGQRLHLQGATGRVPGGYRPAPRCVGGPDHALEWHARSADLPGHQASASQQEELEGSLRPRANR